jgi:hypothetical protein
LIYFFLPGLRARSLAKFTCTQISVWSFSASQIWTRQRITLRVKDSNFVLLLKDPAIQNFHPEDKKIPENSGEFRRIPENSGEFRIIPGNLKNSGECGESREFRRIPQKTENLGKSESAVQNFHPEVKTNPENSGKIRTIPDNYGSMIICVPSFIPCIGHLPSKMLLSNSINIYTTSKYK